MRTATGSRGSTWRLSLSRKSASGGTTSQLSGLAGLRNIGPTTAGWLAEVGISTDEDLDAVGALEAYRRLNSARPSDVNIVALYALEAALLDVPWTDLPLDMRRRLRRAAAGS
ncbi:MAG: competence protein TfoX [Chloroflexi bacterium]|nr:competence protein TfoX [Chloroflexota bacterium]